MSQSHTASRDGRFDVLAEACPTRQVINRIGDRWSLLVLYALERETMRFQQLRRAVDGVSQKMLTQTLRNLERDGLVARTIVCDRPIAVSYALTPMGADLLPIIAAMKAWTQQHFLEVERQNLRYDAETAPGRATVPAGA